MPRIRMRPHSHNRRGAGIGDGVAYPELVALLQG
jgi:hypothetical protein